MLNTCLLTITHWNGVFSLHILCGRIQRLSSMGTPATPHTLVTKSPSSHTCTQVGSQCVLPYILSHQQLAAACLPCPVERAKLVGWHLSVSNHIFAVGVSTPRSLFCCYQFSCYSWSPSQALFQKFLVLPLTSCDTISILYNCLPKAVKYNFWLVNDKGEKWGRYKVVITTIC